MLIFCYFAFFRCRRYFDAVSLRYAIVFAICRFAMPPCYAAVTHSHATPCFFATRFDMLRFFHYIHIRAYFFFALILLRRYFTMIDTLMRTRMLRHADIALTSSTV